YSGQTELYLNSEEMNTFFQDKKLAVSEKEMWPNQFAVLKSLDRASASGLARYSNGLSILIEKIKESDLSGHVTLFKGERSAVAELGVKML
ncbi:MAG: hypothetical protein HQK55_19325, partial [Deltaproteobacteria bacterium]|nr:hypothetical protein [Deltaproteobacteria bacterium]